VRYGYNGRTLTVDLSNRTFTDNEIAEQEWRRYVGGSLMGVVHLLRNTCSGLDSFDSRAPFMLWSSVVSGHPYVGLPRCTFVAKSPLTNGIGEARVEGPFSVALKASGYDGIICHGQAVFPCYLLIENGIPSLHSALDLWGFDTGEATRWLQKLHGNAAEVATIGISGERQVRLANIITSNNHLAARMGLGAVMGSKNLKAIVLSGGNRPEVYDSQTLDEITSTYRRNMLTNILTNEQYEPPGFGALIAGSTDVTGYVGGQNYRTSRLPEMPIGMKSELLDRLIPSMSAGACPGCPNDCIKTFRNSVDDRTGSLDEESLVALAYGLGVTDLDTLLELNAKCHLWGIDPVSLSFTLAMFMDAIADGVPGCDAFSKVIPAFGETEEIIVAMEKVATRHASLALLSEGSERAAASLGSQMAPYAMHVKGQEMVYFDPRVSAGQALAYAVSPVGPRYEIVEHDIDFDPIYGYPHGLDQMRTLGVLDWEPMELLDDRRVMRTAELINLWSGLDALEVCLFAGPPLRGLDLPTVARLVTAVTGWRTSDHEIFTWGRRRWQLMRVYNLREGIGSDQDTLPPRFFETRVDFGEHKGAILEKGNFERALSLYYQLNGWDSKGVPTSFVLAELDLAWAEKFLIESQ
jgi:aldehyde:ferredoxin oxidoreductase